MGVPLANVQVFGKPYLPAYRMAEGLLRRQAEAAGISADFGSIVAIGDNPASDIAGANAAGRSPSSICPDEISVCAGNAMRELLIA